MRPRAVRSCRIRGVVGLHARRAAATEPSQQSPEERTATTVSTAAVAFFQGQLNSAEELEAFPCGRPSACVVADHASHELGHRPGACPAPRQRFAISLQVFHAADKLVLPANGYRLHCLLRGCVRCRALRLRLRQLAVPSHALD